MSIPSEQPANHGSSQDGDGTLQGDGDNDTDARKQQAQQAQVAVAEAFWRQTTRDWYPNLHSQTYFLPPSYFNKVSYGVETVAGQPVLVFQEASNKPNQTPVYFPPTDPPPHPPDPTPAAGILPPSQLVPPGPLPVVYDCDVRDDRAMQLVLHYIQALADSEHEVMLVLSHLEFRKYLDDQVDPINAAAIRLLPRSDTVKKDYQRGEFDVLMISSRYGLIVGEVKSVGTDLCKIPDLCKAVLKVVGKAITQLDKAEIMLKHLASDLPSIRITKTVMLPNLTSTQLRRALSANPQVLQDLCACLKAPDTNCAVARCLCSDNLASTQWWHQSVTDKGPDAAMTQDLYERLVARFCGPATTVEVPTVTTPRRTVGLRTLSEAVALTGLTMAMLTLYPEQVELVNRPGLQRVFLWGPPGTGKTVILVLKGIQWAQQGKDVHLVSSHRNSRAAILLIEHQLQHSLNATEAATPESASASAPAPTSSPRVYTHFYDFEYGEGDVDAAVEQLASAARDEELFVIADEACKGRFVNTSSRFSEFCTRLANRVPALHLWVATVDRDVTAGCLSDAKLTIPVRCPPAVVREIQKSEFLDDLHVPRYTSSAATAPTDGPAVRRIRHWESDIVPPTLSPGHTEGRPEDCERCADAVSDLIEELCGGQSGPQLKYRDTIILCRDPRDNLPVVTSLRGRGLPVQVVRSSDDEAAIRDVAVAALDVVTVAEWRIVSGLERPVVVVMWLGVGNDDERLHALSRCTSLLVWVGLSTTA